MLKNALEIEKEKFIICTWVAKNPRKHKKKRTKSGLITC